MFLFLKDTDFDNCHENIIRLWCMKVELLIVYIGNVLLSGSLLINFYIVSQCKLKVYFQPSKAPYISY